MDKPEVLEPRKAVLYLRVSTKQQATVGTGLDEQYEMCWALALHHGLQVVGVYEDAGLSGLLYQTRPGLQAALRALEAGAATVLLAATASRLARQEAIHLLIQNRVAAAGGLIVLCDQIRPPLHSGSSSSPWSVPTLLTGSPLTDSPLTGSPFACPWPTQQAEQQLEPQSEQQAEPLLLPENQLLPEGHRRFASYEAYCIAQRTYAGRRRKVQQGIQVSRGFSPFGYHIVRHQDVLQGSFPAYLEGRYIVLEEEAKIVREIFRRFAAGISLRQIVAWLNQSGVRTKRGATGWCHSTIKAILENSVYYGQAHWGKAQRLTDESRLQQGYKTVYYWKDRPAGSYLSLDVPALVSQELWTQCQERLQGNREQWERKNTRTFLLTGLLRCPDCGRTLVGVRVNANPTLRRYRPWHGYYCRAIRQEDRPRSRCPSRCGGSGLEMEKTVREEIARLASQIELVENLIAAQWNREQENILQRIQQIEQVLHQLKAPRLKAQEALSGDLSPSVSLLPPFAAALHSVGTGNPIPDLVEPKEAPQSQDQCQSTPAPPAPVLLQQGTLNQEPIGQDGGGESALDLTARERATYCSRLEAERATLLHTRETFLSSMEQSAGLRLVAHQFQLQIQSVSIIVESEQSLNAEKNAALTHIIDTIFVREGTLHFSWKIPMLIPRS